MSAFFTSDLHLGHRKVAELRGFGEHCLSVADHDAAIREGWRSAVRDEDVVYVLGDLSAGGRAVTENTLAELYELPGRKRLIAGNHDPVHPMNREAWKWAARFADVFEHVSPFARIKVLGREVMLSHFPYERDREKPRYMQYRLRDEGLPLLHGHTHGTERLTVTGSRVEVHVGVDAWALAPVSDEQVAALLDEGAAV